jgi:hypothetical protein
MPFQSTISNPGTNVSIAGNPSGGVTAPRVYTFPSLQGWSQLNNVDYYFPTNINENVSTPIYVQSKNLPQGTTLFWTILHQTTSDADFIATSGSFVSSSLAYINGTGTGGFNITTIRDAITEGPELFQIQIREWSTTSVVVATSSVITVNDTSTAPSYIFDSTNPTSLDEGVWGSTFQPASKQFKILTTQVPGGTYLYYTLTSNSPGFSTTSGVDITYYTTDYPSQALLQDGRVYIFSTGYGIIHINGRNDNLTEGTETFQIQLRTGSTTGPIVATSAEISIEDTSPYLGQPTFNFEYQVIGGGAGGPSVFSGGGGGGGGFASGSMAWTSGAPQRVTYYIKAGAGGAPATSGGDTYIRSQYAGNPWLEFFGRGGGRGASTLGAAAWGGGGGGGGGNGSTTQYSYGANQWNNTTGTVIVTINAANRQAGSGGNGAPKAGGGGGGGLGGSGSAANGVAAGSTSPGKGGAGKVNWLGVLCGQGGGGVNYLGTTATRYNGSTNTSGANSGEAGQYQGSGANGVAIIRYPDTKAPAVAVSGTYETYVTGGYRYYIWTSGFGTIRFSN